MKLGEVREACGCEVTRVSDVAWTVSKPGDAAGVCEDPDGPGLIGEGWATHAVEVAEQAADEEAFGGELPPSPSYHRRWWQWVPGVPSGQIEGVLSIGVRKGKRPSSKCEIDVYAVQEAPAPFQAAHGFLILNVSDRESPEVYECVVGGSGLDSCTCIAGLNHKPCKHTAALRALTGVLGAVNV